MKETTNEKLKELKKQYTERLKSQSHKAIEDALRILNYYHGLCQEDEHSTVRIDLKAMDKDTAQIFELINQYKIGIRDILIENGEVLTHISEVPPENIQDGKIKRSIKALNQYEDERDDWVFASSLPVDGTNIYIARKPEGIIKFTKDNDYVFGGDNMIVEQDEQGNNHVYLREPNYAYLISPLKFLPVVAIRKDSEGYPHFIFDDEWVSNEEVDLNDKKQVIGEPVVIRDVTDLVRHNQIFCDINLTNEGNNIKNAKNEEEGIALIKDGIHNGRLRYINGEANINVNNLLIDDQILKKIGEMAMKLKSADIKDARIHIAKNRDYIIPQNK